MIKEELIKALIINKDKLTYINLDNENKYNGWVSDFNIVFDNGKNMYLDLSKERDLFLLFVLAASWSKTGPWENAAYFTTYLKYNKKDNFIDWLDDEFISIEVSNRMRNAKEIINVSKGVVPRKKVSFRKDYYHSIKVLAENWTEIKDKLEKSSKENNFMIFIEYISKIQGLGAGNNKMRIKIPLILRELRCQKIYNNIPGEYCCVPDERVKEACKNLNIKIPIINSIDNLLLASKIIYDNFGDLYDIPLFALDDVIEINKGELKNEK